MMMSDIYDDDDDDVDDDDVKVSEVKWVERQIGEESSFCPPVFCTQPSYFKLMRMMKVTNVLWVLRIKIKCIKIKLIKSRSK